MRGREGTDEKEKTVFGPVSDLPVRFSRDDDLDAFLGENTSYVI